MEHRASTVLRHLVLFFASFLIVFHDKPLVLRSLWIDLRHVSFGRPLFLVPWGVQSRACFVISPLFLRRVWPIHLHVFLLITVPISSWLVLFKSSVLDIVSGQYIFSIFLRHLLIKVCSCLMMALVVFQVSLPYRSISIDPLLGKSRTQHYRINVKHDLFIRKGWGQFLIREIFVYPHVSRTTKF